MKNAWAVVLGVASLAGCTPGYIDSKKLEANGQGPSACVKSCEDLGMRMTAMVLVGDQVPGCVCQPVTTAPIPPATAPGPAADASPEQGAAASSGGFVIIAAAAAARAQQAELQRQQQQMQQKH